MDAAVIANAITTAFAALQAPAAAARGAPFVPVVVNFARTPAQACADLLDYENNLGDAKIFAKATAPLPTTFSLSKPNVTILVSEVQTCSKTSSWGTLMALTINAINLNFLDSNGCLTLPELRVHVNTFINAGSRLAQNDYQMYLCLAESVDSDTKEKMELERNNYLAGQLVVAGQSKAVSYI
jgi:hypothetical protein